MGTFQLTRPRKARPVLPFPLQTYHHFNSRAHARRDGSCRTFPMFHGNFNSRAHARRDEICQILDNVKIKFQLTRPRKARPYNSTHKIPHPHISTHAPTQGATQVMVYQPKFYYISTHAPTQGATTVKALGTNSQTISTHAPTQGATRVFDTWNHPTPFQLTRPRKARPGSGHRMSMRNLFQLTRPRKARQMRSQK